MRRAYQQNSRVRMACAYLAPFASSFAAVWWYFLR
jgi:hypothetical protein